MKVEMTTNGSEVILKINNWESLVIRDDGRGMQIGSIQMIPAGSVREALQFVNAYKLALEEALVISAEKKIGN